MPCLAWLRRGLRDTWFAAAADPTASFTIQGVNTLVEGIDLSVSLGRLPAWRSEGCGITRTFSFSDFAAALAFVNRIGALAEELHHHPDVDIRWNKVTLHLSTHSRGGLTDLDFNLAARIDAIG